MGYWWEHPKCVNLFFCSDGSLARFLDIREQDAPTTNFIFAKLGCSRIGTVLRLYQYPITA
jgi:hypothetical protein